MYSARLNNWIVNRCQLPVLLVSGNRDSLAVGEDVERLGAELPQLVHHIRTDNYHADYITARDEVEHYDQILQFISSHN